MLLGEQREACEDIFALYTQIVQNSDPGSELKTALTIYATKNSSLPEKSGLEQMSIRFGARRYSEAWTHFTKAARIMTIRGSY
jgi:hypothetical protein